MHAKILEINVLAHEKTSWMAVVLFPVSVASFQ